MRNLLLILLLANILYFMWGWLDRGEEQPGVAVVDESELGPPLAVAETPGADEIASVGAVLGSGEASDLAAVVGQSCVTVGPMRSQDDVDDAQTRYTGQGMQVDVRQERGRYFIGHWVQIQDVPTEAEADRIVATLRDGGLSDAYRAVSPEEGIRVFLGLFSSLERAERIELQASSLGFDVTIEPEFREGDIYWVDIALPPGRGAGEIVERYGEESVALRDDARCPKN